MHKQRLLIEISGRAIYLSHLDRMRTFQRAFLRAGMALYHTEGFNPHPYISFALPLPVGMESKCEILDFELVDQTPLEQVADLLNPVLPEGIRVLTAYQSLQKIKELTHLSLHGTWEYDDIARREKMEEKLEGFFKQEEILVRKLNKKKEEVTLDIVPLISEISFTQTDEVIQLNAVLAAQNPGLNPNLLLETLKQNVPALLPDFASFCRLEVLDQNFNIFR